MFWWMPRNFTHSALQNNAPASRLWVSFHSTEPASPSTPWVLDQFWVSVRFAYSQAVGGSLITSKNFACTLVLRSFFSLFCPLIYALFWNIFVTFLCMFLSNSFHTLLGNQRFDLAAWVAYLWRQARGDRASGPSQSLVSRWDLAPGLLGTWKTWWYLLKPCSGLPRQLHLGGNQGCLAMGL